MGDSAFAAFFAAFFGFSASFGNNSSTNIAMNESRASSAVGPPSRSLAGFDALTLITALMMVCLREDILILNVCVGLGAQTIVADLHKSILKT